MKNVSFNTDPIELERGVEYIVIDALYIDFIKDGLSNLNQKNSIEEIRSKVFPYTETPFAEYVPSRDVFNLENIKKVDYDLINLSDRNVLSSDSGILVLINKNLLLDFALKFDYGELVNSSIDLINIDYWRSLVSIYNFSDIALVVSMGINTKFEFDGGGTYRIV